MDTKAAGRKGGLTKWAKVKGKRKRSEIMKRVRRGRLLNKPEADMSDSDTMKNEVLLRVPGTRCISPESC